MNTGSKATFNDSHIFRLTDDTGIFQHTLFDLPDLGKGYTTDDNARALLIAVMLYEQTLANKYLTLIYRYLSFVLYAQTENGLFRNFMGYNRMFIDEIPSDDCFGRCLWALGYTAKSAKLPRGIQKACENALRKAQPHSKKLVFPRSKAYAILGLYFWQDASALKELAMLADDLAGLFNKNADTDWHWFEGCFAYDNALLPWSMYLAYKTTKTAEFLQIADDSLHFLDHIVFRNGFFQPIGCKGWYPRGGKPALYDQQPVEASISTLAHSCAFQIPDNAEWLELAQKSFAWYHGENCLGQSLLNPDTGGCYDGLTEQGVNLNQGSESIVGYAMAHSTMLPYQK